MRPTVIRVGDHDAETSGEPSRYQVRETFQISRDMILEASGDLKQATDNLIAAFCDGRHAEINQAAHFVQKYARQVDGLATSLIKGCVDQMNRRPRT